MIAAACQGPHRATHFRIQPSQCRLKLRHGGVQLKPIPRAFFTARKLLEDSLDERAGKSHTRTVVCMSPSLYRELESRDKLEPRERPGDGAPVAPGRRSRISAT